MILKNGLKLHTNLNEIVIPSAYMRMHEIFKIDTTKISINFKSILCHLWKKGERLYIGTVY